MRGVPRVIFGLILFTICSNYGHSKQQYDTKLIEVRTTDSNGNVKARVIVKRVAEGPGQDDEDSKSPEGSGDREDSEINVKPADASIKIVNNTSSKENSTSFIISPSPSIISSEKSSQIHTSSNAVSKTQTLAKEVTSTREEKATASIVIKPSRTITSTQSTLHVIETVKPSDTINKVKTEPKTSQSATTISSTTQYNINTPTSKSVIAVINGTEPPVVITKKHDQNVTQINKVEKTRPIPTQKSTESSVNVKAQRDPTEKPKKTLFGFVTVEILIALLAGALFSILLVAFLVYRLKKRNEGSYELSETIALRPKELDEMGTKKEVFV